MGQRVNRRSKLKPIGGGVQNWSLNRAMLLVHFLAYAAIAIVDRSEWREFLLLDPKPSDLAMSRLKE